MLQFRQRISRLSILYVPPIHFGTICWMVRFWSDPHLAHVAPSLSINFAIIIFLILSGLGLLFLCWRILSLLLSLHFFCAFLVISSLRWYRTGSDFTFKRYLALIALDFSGFLARHSLLRSLLFFIISSECCPPYEGQNLKRD